MTGAPQPAEDQSFTIGQLRALVPGFSRMLDRNSPVYATFISALYDDIDDAIRQLESNRNVRQDDSEDRTTEEVVGYLNAKGYTAGHDSSRSGHCDVVVENASKLEWLGEAKIHGAYDYLYKGFQQLCTRYSTATPTSSAGGMLIYIHGDKAAKVVTEWRSLLSAQGLTSYADEDCIRRKGLAFYSTHEHDTSGLPYRVRHMAVIMKFDPKDTGAGAKLIRPAKTT